MEQPVDPTQVDKRPEIGQILDGAGAALNIAKPLMAPLSALDERDLDILQLVHNTGSVDAVFDGSSETDLGAAKRLLSLLDGGYLRKA